ncbi:MAG: DEAD/DEAH box helicase [Gammaproteobacteria bacterium]
MNDPASPTTVFADLGLSPTILAALDDVGYEVPTAIQAQTIPPLLAGHDLIGQAQTGTGKTAAFALPILSHIDIEDQRTQALVLAPTRELAIQVAEAFQRYANHLRGFHVLPIYGGQEYGIQLRALKRGVHVVVGTPGRVMDHMRRGTLSLSRLKHLVLDEADEMLRMGFIEDIEWILEQSPRERQTALFSATMPKPIRQIAERYLTEPEEVSIRLETVTAATIRQRYWKVAGLNKLDALTRILETESVAGVLIFVRTKNATVELSERLEARGFASGAINGDMPQKHRERTIDHLKSGKLDLLVATDVAARGLDVDRISHVINYDIPYDPESYVHRIGRTGRAGRAGNAILFVTNREMRMLRLIEKTSGHEIERMELPSVDAVNETRRARFTQTISDTIASQDLDPYRELLKRYQQQENLDPITIAAALAAMTQGDQPFLLAPDKRRPQREPGHHDQRPTRRERGTRRDSPGERSRPASGMETYRLKVGHKHDVKPGNIVGAIANEAGLDASDIGRIDIEEAYSFVDLPAGMPKEIFMHLKKVWVAGQQLRISRLRDGDVEDEDAPKRKPEKPHTGGGKKSGKQSSRAAKGSDKSKPNRDQKPRKKDRHRDRKKKGSPTT